MSGDFKPGTRPLLRLAGLDAERPYISRDGENDALWTVVLALMMRFYLIPDPEARRATGSADAQVVGAMRIALAENFGLESAEHLAWALVHYGCRQKPTLASLPPWERMMFDWQDRRATAPRIALMLRGAGFAATLSPAALEAIDGWIMNPATALGRSSEMLETLFGPRVIAFKLVDDGVEPAHIALFRTLIEGTIPAQSIALPRQRLHSEGSGDRWVIDYRHDGVDRSFEVAANGTSTDVEGVADGVDALFARMGRPERVFRFVPGATHSGLALFIVADGALFADLDMKLRFPLLRGPLLPEGVVTAPAGGPATAPPVAAPPAPTPAPVPAPVPTPAPVPVSPPVVARASVTVPVTVRAPVPVPLPAESSLSLPPLPGSPSMFDSDFGATPGAASDADAAMRGLMGALRRSFGTGRMLRGSGFLQRARTEPPARLAANDPMAVAYGQQLLLLRKGRLVWGALVRPDPALHAAGGEDAPSLLVLGEDAWFDARPAELGAIGARLSELRLAADAPPDLRDFRDRIRHQAGHVQGVPVPAAVGSHDAVVTSAMVMRAHLPGGVLAAEWVPVLTLPSNPIPMILPSVFWTAALRAAWDTNQLRLDPHRAG